MISMPILVSATKTDTEEQEDPNQGKQSASCQKGDQSSCRAAVDTSPAGWHRGERLLWPIACHGTHSSGGISDPAGSNSEEQRVLG
jgi:hypothetical protein